MANQNRRGMGVKPETAQKMNAQYSTVDIFDELFKLYDAVQQNQAAREAISNSIYRAVQEAIDVLHPLPDEAKEKFIENIKTATLLASMEKSQILDVPEIIATIKTPRQYKYLDA